MAKTLVEKALIGIKIGTTQLFDKDGTVVDVTAVYCEPNFVVQKKTLEKDGYKALQLGVVDKKEKNTTKPLLGHFKKAGISPKRYLKEFKFSEEVYEKVKEGDTLTLEQFTEGEFVDVTGKTKGRGFTGVMKRWNFAGRPASHGTHETFRGPGSIGMATFPGRVYKGRKMPGRYGNETVTIQNLLVYKIDKDKNVIYIRGHIPGPKGAPIYIKNSVKK